MKMYILLVTSTAGVGDCARLNISQMDSHTQRSRWRPYFTQPNETTLDDDVSVVSGTKSTYEVVPIQGLLALFEGPKGPYFFPDTIQLGIRNYTKPGDIPRSKLVLNLQY